MHRRIALFTMLIVVLFASLVQASDKEDIKALINEYNRLDEAGDMMTQGKLMTSNRIYVFPGGRYTSETNQAWNMKYQQALSERRKQVNPGTKVFITAVDPIIRVYGNAAVASFIRYTNVVPSVDRKGPIPPPAPVIITLVLVKQDGSWKIDLSHFSSLYPPIGN